MGSLGAGQEGGDNLELEEEFGSDGEGSARPAEHRAQGHRNPGARG